MDLLWDNLSITPQNGWPEEHAYLTLKMNGACRSHFSTLLVYIVVREDGSALSKRLLAKWWDVGKIVGQLCFYKVTERW